MHAAWPVLLDVGIALAAAFLLGALMERLRQSAVVGYIAAGVLVGPGALALVSDTARVDAFAQFGLALLLFVVGLEFSWRRLRRLGYIATGGGALQVAATMAATWGAARMLGIPSAEALALGGILAMSSDSIVLRELAARAELDSVHGRAAVGITLFQDIAVIPLALLLAFLGGRGGAGAGGLAPLAGALAGAAFIVGVMLLLGRFVLPRALAATSELRNRELAVILSVVLCLGAMAGAHAAGLPVPLGAFLAGMLVAGTPFADSIRADLEPFRAVLLTLFFTSVGMLIEPRWLAANPALLVALTLAIVVGKTLVVWGVGRLFGLSHKAAVAAGLTLAQIGELAFMLAAVSLGSGLMREETYVLFVAATAVSLLLTPYLIAAAPACGARVERALERMGLASRAAVRLEAIRRIMRNHVVVVGYGPAGRRVVNALRAVGAPSIIIELNPAGAAQAQRDGLAARIGDATQAEILEGAHLAEAQALVVTIPDPRTTEDVVRRAKALAPRVPVIARARFHKFAEELRAAGADRVVDEEDLMGERLGDEILRHVGMPAEAIERADEATLSPEQETPRYP